MSINTKDDNLFKRMNIMKKVMAVASGVTDGYGGDQAFREWAKLNNLDFTVFNSVNPELEKAMLFACVQGELEFCKLLFKMGVDIRMPDDFDGFTPMHVACRNGYLSVCKWLFEVGDAEDIRAIDNADRCTPMIFACESGHLSVCEWLFMGAAEDIRISDYFGRRPMYIASEYGHLSV